MRNLYKLKNIRTGVIEHDGLYARDVHELIGIHSSTVCKYAKDGTTYNDTWRILLSDVEGIDDEQWKETWESCRRMVLRGMRRARKKGWSSYKEMVERGTIKRAQGAADV